MNLLIISFLAAAVLALLARLWFLKTNPRSDDQTVHKPIVSVTGQVKSAEGIDQVAISKIEMYEEHLLINQVAMIPLHRIQRAEFIKHVKNEKGVKGAPVQRYFGELTIHFTNKNGAEASIVCSTPKKNQFHHIYQYDVMKKTLNKALGIEDLQNHLAFREPYEL
ncbi:hypothetical protein [Priestia flexa]|uniref:hypothetical protein n=1 Tax=Priestia flexa TaxID=86664 RepID=UPI00095669DD|nr:hypothetical protein [Priestia flexa]MCA1201852.1 hypothetical protein [Priestia flexa]MCG7313776.1 hypothetical protein [Priestia flexa]MCM3067222.1 hypothetical protein [Priestia flexa]WEZ06867.1 hypothetical protein P5663_12210 [Priestia flexa]WHX77497.1 hypothetical protein QNH32_11125 [Priestia flexa]